MPTVERMITPEAVRRLREFKRRNRVTPSSRVVTFTEPGKVTAYLVPVDPADATDSECCQ